MAGTQEEHQQTTSAAEAADLFRRLQQLFADAGLALTGAEVERVVVPAIVRAAGAVAGSLGLIDGSTITVLSAHGYDPAVTASFGRFPLDASLPLAEAAATGTTVVLDKDEFRTRYPAVAPLVRHAIIALPVTVSGTPIGAVGLSYEEAPAFDDTQVAFLEAVASQVGAVLERVRLHEATVRLLEERTAVAKSLQAALLPPTMPSIPGFELAAGYQAAVGDVGGDFYDAIALPDDRWVLVLGDVQGRGPDAAAASGLARQILRAGSFSAASPSELLSHLDRVLADDPAHPPAGEPGIDAPRLITLAVLMLRAPSGPGLCRLLDAPASAHRVQLALAGHPRPLLARSADAGVAPVGRPGTLVGLAPRPSSTDTAVELLPGDVLVAFTDGLIERHHGGWWFDEQSVGPVLARTVHQPADVIAAAILEAADRFGGPERKDDTAVLVLKRLP